MTPSRSHIGNARFRDALARMLVETVEFPLGALVTLTDAKIAANQKNAVGFLSVFPREKQEDVLRTLASAQRAIKDALAHTLKLRHIPHIEWRLDEREEYAANIEATLKRLKEQGEL